MSTNYYDILGVDKNASPDEIKKAYRKIAHAHHPDKTAGNKESEAKFKQANNAYEVLSDAQKKANYDRFGSADGQQQGYPGGFQRGGYSNVDFDFGGQDFGGFGDMEDVIKSMFGQGVGFGGGRPQQQSSRRKGVDLEMIIDLTLEEVAEGVTKTFDLKHTVVCKNCKGLGWEPKSRVSNCDTCKGGGTVYRTVNTIFGAIQQQSTCPTCNGRGKTYETKCGVCQGQCYTQEIEEIEVKIPVGINEGERIRLKGKGEAGYQGSESGDLFLVVRLTQHSKLAREGIDVNSVLELDYFDLILGKKVDVYTVWGEVEVSVPSMTNPEARLRIKEKGLPKLNNPKIRGDHYLKLKIRMPKDLTKSDLEMIEKMRV